MRVVLGRVDVEMIWGIRSGHSCVLVEDIVQIWIWLTVIEGSAIVRAKDRCQRGGLSFCGTNVSGRRTNSYRSQILSGDERALL